MTNAISRFAIGLLASLAFHAAIFGVGVMFCGGASHPEDAAAVEELPQLDITSIDLSFSEMENEQTAPSAAPPTVVNPEPPKPPSPSARAFSEALPPPRVVEAVPEPVAVRMAEDALVSKLRLPDLKVPDSPPETAEKLERPKSPESPSGPPSESPQGPPPELPPGPSSEPPLKPASLPSSELPSKPPSELLPGPPPGSPPGPPPELNPPHESERASIPPQQESAASASAPARIDVPPSPRRNIKPKYPEGARKRGEQGDVTLELEIDAQGTVSGVRVIASCGFAELEQAAMAAARRARFRPAKRGHASVNSTARLTLTFRLRD